MSSLIEKYTREMVEEGRAEGEARGEAKSLLRSLEALMANLGLTADAAMDALNVPPSDRADYLAKLA